MPVLLVIDDSDRRQATKTSVKVSTIQSELLVTVFAFPPFFSCSICTLFNTFLIKYSNIYIFFFSAGRTISKHYYRSSMIANLIDGSCMSNGDT